MQNKDEDQVLKIVRESLSDLLDNIAPEYDRKIKIIEDLNNLGCEIDNFGPFLIKTKQ